MPSRLTAYGGPIRSEIQLTSGETAPIIQRRVLWFDRDIDGRWMVWASEDRDPRDIPEAEQPVEVGALIVQDPIVSAFLEQLGELLLAPDRFAHEPHFTVDAQH